MKKVKYLIGIIIICVVVFMGIQMFKKTEVENDNKITEVENDDKIAEIEKEVENNNKMTEIETEVKTDNKIEEIKTGKELLEKAEKILVARGWAGASNNIIGIKDNILYYYNQGTGEFRKISTDIEDIYYASDIAEDITVKQGKNAEKFGEELNFLIYE